MMDSWGVSSCHRISPEPEDEGKMQVMMIDRYTTRDACPTADCRGQATFDWLEVRDGSKVVKRRLTGAVCDADCFADDAHAANRAAEAYAESRSIG